MSAISVHSKIKSSRKSSRSTSHYRRGRIAAPIRVNWTDNVGHLLYEMKSFFRAEVVGAVIDTIRLGAFIRSELTGEARRAARPLTHKVADAVESNNLAREFVNFVGDGARVVVKR